MDGSACASLYLNLYNDKKKRKEWLCIFKIEIMEANILSQALKTTEKLPSQLPIVKM